MGGVEETIVNLPPEAETNLRGLHQGNPELSLKQLCLSVKETLGIELNPSTVSGFFKRVGEVVTWPRSRGTGTDDDRGWRIRDRGRAGPASGLGRTYGRGDRAGPR
jgi:hypothetical protein